MEEKKQVKLSEVELNLLKNLKRQGQLILRDITISLSRFPGKDNDSKETNELIKKLSDLGVVEKLNNNYVRLTEYGREYLKENV